MLPEGRSHVRRFVLGMILSVLAASAAVAQTSSQASSQASAQVASQASAEASAQASAAVSADTLAKVRDTGTLVIGFREDARPFSYRTEAGEPAGYSVDLCRRIATAVKDTLALDAMEIVFEPVPVGRRLEMLTSGAIDIECGSTTHTLERREQVDFTLLTFVTGAEMLTRVESEITGLDALAGRTVGVLEETTTEQGLRAALRTQMIDATVETFDRHETGLAALEDGAIDAYFADRILLLGLASEARDPSVLELSGQFYSYEPYAFMVRRGDHDFRRVADGALAALYRSGRIWNVYDDHFGGAEPSEMLVALFILQGLPQR